jgi:hypothetical protein
MWRGLGACGATCAAGRRSGRSVGAAFGKERIHPYFSPEDGLDAPFGAGFGEAHGAVKAIVVGEGQGRLP